MQESVDMKSLPTVHELKEKAAAGHQFTREEVRNLVEAEMMATGAPGPMRKGPAATIQSIYDAQQHFADKAEEMVGKPESEISRHDAKELHSAEVSMGGLQPPHGSLSSEAQHIVDSRDDY
ncbi:hypothetical protein L211DRAFT_787370 [Terfezia boudieri ATCC MYA-4762]|uniref:SMP domain-containing protein n=1 Tax=Terfezia boudieri ATCC MYA-4762 TaxID=1051890 RepID=A0A3N4LYG6_9PEZI|nr:hypothetical protein L211DRAFT_787370 [Terfezia boudieri ATCC MYA-4762]